MFNKTSKPTTSRPDAVTPTVAPPPLDIAPAAPALNLNRTLPPVAKPQSAKGLSTLGAGIVIEGNVSGSGDLVIEGTVHGDIKVTHLTVGEAGNVEGTVEADTVEVRGRIVGSIKGTQVKLQNTAYVEGDITHEQLAIDVGAYFQGRCLQTRPAPAPVPAATAPATVAPAAAAPVQAAPATPASVTPSSVTPAAPVVGAPSLGSYDMNALADLK